MSIASELTQPRSTYVHVDGCRAVSTVGLEVARSLADDNHLLDDLYCTGCRGRRPIVEFCWTERDGTPGERVRVEE